MNKHKHYQQIRAYADGWRIEFLDSNGWKEIDNPSFAESCEYRIAPDKDDWLPWYGGESPFLSAPNHALVTKFADNTVSRIRPAKDFDWSDHNLIAYREVSWAELHESKPKTVKMWQWVVKYGTGAPCITTHFFKSENEVKGVDIIQRADWTEIEVEE